MRKWARLGRFNLYDAPATAWQGFGEGNTFTGGAILVSKPEIDVVGQRGHQRCVQNETQYDYKYNCHQQVSA